MAVSRLIPGDCLDVLPTLDAGCASLVVYDPPYAVGSPILIVSRGVPDAVDRSAVRNVVETDWVVEADYPTRRSHPYEKPAKIFREVFPRLCKPGDLVVDPFAGSGVTRLVAGELGLDWLGVEIDPKYSDGLEI